MVSIGDSILVAVYRDNFLRTWDVAAGKKLSASGLLAEASGRTLAAKMVRISSPSAGDANRRVAIVFEPSEGTPEEQKSSQVGGNTTLHLVLFASRICTAGKFKSRIKEWNDLLGDSQLVSFDKLLHGQTSE